MFPRQNNDYNKLIYVPNPDFQPRPAPPAIESLMESIRKEPRNESFRSHHWNLNRQQRLLLRSMRYQKNLKIVNTDKNLGPAVMTMTQYHDFCMQHLNSPSTYQRLPDIPLQETIAKVRAFHRRLTQSFPFESKNAKIIVHQLEMAKPAYFHGIPKIHKNPMGCRPIVSNVNSPTCGLSRWLTFKLLPLTGQLHSSVKDSRELQRIITSLEVIPDGQFYSFDVENMYTSIPVDAALQSIKWFLTRTRDPQMEIILEGLSIVMSENYFSFGDTYWKQLKGLAMGTPVAPVLAALYLGYYEEEFILSRFESSLYLYKRYLDDVLIIWKPQATDMYRFNRFRATLRQVPGLTWTFEQHQEEINFLDLWIYKNGDFYGTRTHQKQLNLYLYPTFNSAHPPGVFKGLIYGLLQKYQDQNTKRSDFLNIARLFFDRLCMRGYRSETLKPLFNDVIATLRVQRNQRTPDTERKFFFKIPYDPNGPSRTEIKKIFQLDSLSQVIKDGRIVICYTRPNNLGNILMRTRYQPATPAAASSVQPARSVNPNPNETG